MTDKIKINQAKLKKAKEMDNKFKRVRIAFRAHWSIYGRLACEFESEGLFRLLGYGSMKQYLKSLDKVCYSTIAEAMAVCKSFPDMKIEEISQYPKENLKILAKLPESKRSSSGVLAAARTMKEKDLRAKINERFSTHLEDKARIIFDVEASAVSIIEGAIEKKQAEDDDEISRGTALEYICAEYLQS